ncbi:MAG: ABC transporter substrate-binding protein [Candidatus Aminicenantes bacterium]|nr:ABC transporter substrate-binding protein [Candidatus Aminicenantes bacterium]
MPLTMTLLFAERPVTYVRITDSLTLDPGKIEDFFSQEVIFNVFEGLVRLRRDRMEAEPSLAVRWMNKEGGRRWIFHLRRGVRFHDGSEFNAAAVVYSFAKRIENKAGEYASFGRFFPYILAVRALDQWTVEFVLSRPYAPFLLALVDQRGKIVAPGSMDGPRFAPIGTGPYAFSEWNKGRSIVLTRFPRYWEEPAGPAKIIFKHEPNVARRLSQIKNRSADINLIRSAKEYDELLGKPHVGIVSEPKLITFYLGFNCRRRPFSLLPARKAFAHLLQKEILIKTVFQKFAVPAGGMLPPQMPGFAPQIGQDEFSLEKARRLLEKAGLAHGFSCRLYFSEGQFGLEEVAGAIAANARRVGIEVQCVRTPFENMIRQVQGGEPDLFLLGWGYTGDPGVFLNPMFMFFPGDAGNIMSASPEFIDLLAQAETSENADRRGELYAAAQRRLHEDMPLIPLFYLNHVLAYSTRLSNVHMDPFGFLIFKDMRLEGN